MTARKPRTRARAGSRAKTKPVPRRRGWLKWLLAATVLGAVVVGGYSLYLAQTVRVKFEGKRWAVPARVYARPLEIYEGVALTVAQLEYELGAAGYRKGRAAREPGQWSRDGGRLLVRTRPFRFWDDEQPALLLDVRIANDRVTALAVAPHGASDALVRLPPVEVGSIYPAHNEDRILVQRSDLPEYLIQALLAAEDRRFFDHHGVDPRGIARALWANLRAGRTVQGGSTLTQQLVKNFVLTSERSLARKLNEALMALLVEMRYGKDEILEAYANEIYLGQDGERAIHGFGLAAYYYFNRPLNELRLHEAALLVGVVKGASYYNPRRHPERALERRNLVLQQMVEQGFIDAASATAAQRQGLGLSSRAGRSAERHPAFIDLVRRQLRRDYREQDLTSEGLRVFTTLDPWAQHVAGEVVEAQLGVLEQQRKLTTGTLQAALVLASPQAGEVQVLIGDRDAGYAGFNRALDAVRPIGSLVKPAVYLAALAQPERYTLISALEDRPITLKLPNGDPWKPENYDHKTRGAVALHTALTDSLNLATVHLGLDIGIASVLDTLERLGVQRPLDPYPSLLLGAASLTPLEVTQVYQTLAAGGFRSPLRAIREVLDTQGRPLQRYPLTVAQAVAAGPVFLVSRNLVEVVESGTARGLRRYLGKDIQVAGKTGTTNDLRDSWFAGYSGDRVGVVWIGRDDNQSIGLSGATGALTVWGRTLAALTPQTLVLAPPDAVAYHWIDPATGALANEQCKGAVAYPFIQGSEPRTRSPCLRGSGGVSGFLENLFN